MMINKKTITFTQPLNINGKTIESFTNDTRIVCNERCERYFIERAFEANGFSRVRLDGQEAKLEDQMNKEYEDFLYAPGAPSLGFYPKTEEIEKNAQIIYGLGTVAVLEFIDDCNAWPSVESYKELNAKLLQDRKIRLEANIKKNETVPAVETAKEEKESTTSVETVAVVEEPKVETTNLTAETVAVVEQPKAAADKAENKQKQPKAKEDKIAKNAAPWTRPMTPVDETGKPAPEESAPQMTQQVGINVIPNAKPVEQPKAEKPKVSEPIYDENQDLKAILPGNEVWQAVVKAAEVKVRLNVIPTPNSGIISVLAFGKGSKKYMPEKSFYLDLGCIIDGSAKVIPIIPQDKPIEDKDFMVITESDTSNLEKFLTNGRMPGKKNEEEQALLQELRKANHFVELATLEQRASLVEFAKLINTDKVVQDHVKKYGGARFRVAACDKNLGVVTLLMDQTCTDSILHKPCGPAQPYQAVLIKGQPTQINCVAVAA